MGSTSDWPLPSNSRRVRAFFYLADGLVMGNGLIILFGLFISLVFLLYRTFLDGFASSGIALFVFVIGYLIVHRTTAFREVLRTAPDDPPEANDWKQTRDWTTMGAVVLLIAGGGSGLLFVLWTLFKTLLLSVLLPIVFFQLGIAFRLYGFHRLGMRVL